MDYEALYEIVRPMVDSDGWSHLKEFINDRIADNKNRLMTCELKDVIKHRAKAEALESVLLHVQDIMNEGSGKPP